MDDLAGLNWSSPDSKPQPPAQASNANYFPTLKPTPPTSRGSTPAPPGGVRPGSTGPSKTGTPAIANNDSFANLLPFGGSGNQPAKQVSLQEQQKALQEQRARNLGFQDLQWTGGSGLGSGHSSPARALSPALSGSNKTTGPKASTAYNAGAPKLKPTSGLGSHKPTWPTPTTGPDSEDDILAAFNSSAPVDRSTHFPPPTSRSTSTGPPANDAFAALDDDDPFGLGTGPAKASPAPQQAEDDDDVLGLLGKPVSDIPHRPKSSEAPKPQNPRDKAVAELVDMGFSAEKASKALASTESGNDVQAAVGWLLNQAHTESSGRSSRGTRERAPPRQVDDPSAPAWMRQERSSSGQRQQQTNGEERDPAKMASEMSSSFFKSANSLWKTGQKRLNKAVAEFNTDGDPSQPRWMRETSTPSTPEEAPRWPKRQESDSHPPKATAKQPGLVDMTDEAMLLESGGGRPIKTQPKAESRSLRSETQPSGQARPSQPAQPNRRFVEEESAQAYVSPARRKKATPKPEPGEPELLFDSEAKPASKPARATPKPTPAPTTRPRPSTPPRPKVPPRNIPNLSSIALQSSTSHRLKGNAAFKLGNYGEATTAYTASLRDVPDKHPLAILLLTNRALTNLKTGDPKAAIADAESAMEVIGPSRGQDESVDVGGDEGTKPMAPFWGKAMMRRAEALEQLERWADAGKAWSECVKAGVGGAQSIQARNRCEKALAPKPARPPPPKRPAAAPKPRPKPRGSAMDDLNGRPGLAAATSGEAVTRLRAANAAANKTDEEKFALADSIDARLTQWRKGKEGNLRALLGSLDTVLWEGASWKKVGMSELIVPGKVKIAYMKGIAKVHPDKLPPGASTEQVMISGAVFSTLNEAWDRFKAENGL